MSLSVSGFKGTICSFGGEIQTLTKQAFLRGKYTHTHTPEHSLKLERWQGQQNINSMKLCCPFEGQLVHSDLKTKRLLSLLRHLKKSVNGDLSLLITTFYLKLRSAPFLKAELQQSEVILYLPGCSTCSNTGLYPLSHYIHLYTTTNYFQLIWRYLTTNIVILSPSSSN